MKRKLAFLLSVLMLVSLLAGCGGSKTEDAAAGKTLTFGCQMYSDGMIAPWMQTNCAWNCMRYGISESLFEFDDNSKPIPCLAESIENSDDHLTWTIKLKDGIKFSNGVDMTATKVKYALDWVREKGPEGSSTPENFLEFAAVVDADDARAKFPDSKALCESGHKALVKGDHKLDYAARPDSCALEALFLIVSQALEVLFRAAECDGVSHGSGGGYVVYNLALGNA